MGCPFLLHKYVVSLMSRPRLHLFFKMYCRARYSSIHSSREQYLYALLMVVSWLATRALQKHDMNWRVGTNSPNSVMAVTGIFYDDDHRGIHMVAGQSSSGKLKYKGGKQRFNYDR